MGVAITSGVLASLQPHHPLGHVDGPQKWELHTPGTRTPTTGAELDPSLPSRFIACVKREDTAKRLRSTFGGVAGGSQVEVLADRNVDAVKQADVVLLWYGLVRSALCDEVLM